MPPGFRILTDLRALWARRDTIRFLTVGHLKAGHRDKVLGHLWNLLDPLGFMLVYYFVFGVLFGMAGGGARRSGEFMIYIFVGLIVWRFINAAVSQAAGCIRSNRGIIHEINFPKGVFPASITFAHLYDLLWGLAVLLGAILISGFALSIHVLWLPVLLAVLCLFVLGLSLLFACVGTFFADTSNVLNVVMRLWFYCSPIFYYVRGEQSLLKNHPTLAVYYMFNPVACFFESFRDVLLYARGPEFGRLGYAALISVLIFVIGLAAFSRNEGRFVKYV
jgi:ABC-type polysaccharide/polyol phosphate export permease